MPRPTTRFPSLARIEAALAASAAPAAEVVDAAVMLCLRTGADRELELLLCRRSARSGDPWSGHMGLPGGRRQVGDADALAVAVRETIEEVGFDPTRDGRVLGSLGVVRGRGRQVRSVRVAPFVVVIEAAVELRLSTELAGAWWVPVGALVPARVVVPELPVSVPAYLAPIDGDASAVVWGMTHRMLTLLRRAVRAV